MSNAIIKNADGSSSDMNGLPISLRGSTAYKNVFFGRAGWNQTEAVYIALAGLSKEEQELCGWNTHLFHLSRHETAVEAAYAAMKFDENREANVLALKTTRPGMWETDMPVFKFEQYDTQETLARRAMVLAKMKNMPVHAPAKKTFKARVMKPKMKTFGVDNRSADKFFEVLFAKYDVQALVKKFGRDVVLAARKALTINEFEMRFGL